MVSTTIETERTLSGFNFHGADGSPIPHKGEKTIKPITREGGETSMKFQLCPVNKALGSVSKIVKNGSRVIFDESGSYIQNKKTGNVIWLREQDGLYMLDVKVKPNCPMGFHWQER